MFELKNEIQCHLDADIGGDVSVRQIIVNYGVWTGFSEAVAVCENGDVYSALFDDKGKASPFMKREPQRGGANHG